MKYSSLTLATVVLAQTILWAPTASLAGNGFATVAGYGKRLDQTVSYKASATLVDGRKALKIDSYGKNDVWLSSVLLPEKAGLQDLASASHLGHKVVVVDSWTKMKYFIEKSKRSTFVKTSEDVAFRFPKEAFGFFLAVGILNVKDLTTNYAANPLILEQYLSSQKDPLGHLGFLAFMMTSGHLTGPLMAATDPNAKLTRAIIPYLGMAAGMIASNVTHEIFSISETAKCVADLKTRVEDEKKYASCQKAYDTWMSYTEEKLIEMAPGLASMIGSTIASGAIERFGLHKAVMAVGWEVLLSTTPVGWSVRGARYLYKVMQFGMFTQLDIWMRPIFEVPFKNIVDGGAFLGYERNLMTLLADKKSNSWTQTMSNEDDKHYDIDLELRRLESKMKAWREFQMAEVMTAHSSWIQYLSNFASTYQGAKVFYPFFVNELITKAKNRPGWPSLTQLGMPLNGVTPKALEDPNTKLNLLAMPTEYENRQILTLIDVRKKYETLLQTPEAKRRMALRSGGEVIQKVLQMLPTENDWETQNLDQVKMGRGLDLMLQTLRIGRNREPSYPGISTIPVAWGVFGDWRDILSEMYSAIGKPEPIWSKGAGFFVAYDQDAEAQKIQSVVQNPISSDFITTFKPSQYYVAQMLLGPSASGTDTLAKNANWGGMAAFIPPRIVPKFEYDFSRPIASGGAYAEQVSLFNVPVQVSGGGGSINFPNFFEVLSVNNLVSEVIDKATMKSKVPDWWAANVETKFVQAFKEYEDKYQTILLKLVEKMQDKSDPILNTGNVAANVLDSLRQERRIYLMTLGEIFKDLSLDQGKPYHGLLDSKSTAPDLQKIQPKPWETRDRLVAEQGTSYAHLDATPLVPLLKIVRINSNLNFSHIMRTLNKNNRQIKAFNRDASVGNLAHQTEIEEQFMIIEKLLTRFEIKTTETDSDVNAPLQGGNITLPQNGSTVSRLVVSDVSNRTLEEAQKNAENSIKKFEQMFVDQGLQLSPFQKQIVQSCLHGLGSVLAETTNLGLMANTASYKRKNDEVKGMVESQKDCLTNAQATTKTDRTGRQYQLAAAKCSKMAPLIAPK